MDNIVSLIQVDKISTNERKGDQSHIRKEEGLPGWRSG